MMAHSNAQTLRLIKMDMLLDAQGNEWLSMQVSTYQTTLIVSFSMGVIVTTLILIGFKVVRDLFF